MFSSTDQTLAGEGFTRLAVVLEQTLGCCGLGPAEALGQLQGIAVECSARLTAVVEAARIVLLWNKLV